MPPSSPGQLFNYPGLLIVPGTRRSGAEAGPAPVNDWLFHHAPLGTAGRCRDRVSRRAAGSFRSAVASAFFFFFLTTTATATTSPSWKEKWFQTFWRQLARNRELSFRSCFQIMDIFSESESIRIKLYYLLWQKVVFDVAHMKPDRYWFLWKKHKC